MDVLNSRRFSGLLLMMWASECPSFGGSGLSWVVGDAEELPFDDDQFDFYTIAFGIRNVTHIEQVSDSVVMDLGGKTDAPIPTVGFMTQPVNNLRNRVYYCSS